MRLYSTLAQYLRNRDNTDLAKPAQLRCHIVTELLKELTTIQKQIELLKTAIPSPADCKVLF